MKLFSKNTKALILCCVFCLVSVVLSGCDEGTENKTTESSTKQDYTSGNEPAQDVEHEIIFDFVTQTVENIERIAVMLDSGDQKTIHLTEQPQIEHIYSLLEETTVIGIEEHPGHSTHPMWGSHFIILLEYQDGGVDEFHTAENPELILRLLDTRGGSGDRGFIIGINEILWEYILKGTS